MLKKVRAGAAPYPKFTFRKEHAARLHGHRRFRASSFGATPECWAHAPSFSANLEFHSGKCPETELARLLLSLDAHG
jgi:hypothetical protein